LIPLVQLHPDLFARFPVFGMDDKHVTYDKQEIMAIVATLWKTVQAVNEPKHGPFNHELDRVLSWNPNGLEECIGLHVVLIQIGSHS
jgi:hypothetical protein